MGEVDKGLDCALIRLLEERIDELRQDPQSRSVTSQINPRREKT